MKTARVLLVEDNLDLAALEYQVLCTQQDLEVLKPVHDGVAARRALETEQVDILLLDLNIPPPDGLSLLRWMGTRPEPMPPVLVTSACMDETIQREALHLGAKYFMIKPYSMEDLLANVRMLLRRDTDTRRLTAEQQQRLDAAVKCAAGMLRRMTDRVECEGYRHLLAGVRNCLLLGRPGITIKAMSTRVTADGKPNPEDKAAESAMYRLIRTIWAQNSPAYRELCAFCGAPPDKRLPNRRFIVALAEYADSKCPTLLKRGEYDGTQQRPATAKVPDGDGRGGA